MSETTRAADSEGGPPDEATERLLLKAGLLLTSSLDYQQTLQSIADLLLPALGDWFIVDLVEQDQDFAVPVLVAHVDPGLAALVREYRLRFPARMNASSGVAKVIRTGRAELHAELNDAAVQENRTGPEEAALLRRMSPQSEIIAPLLVRDRAIGALTLVSGRAERRYGPHELAVVEGIARHAAIAIENARIHAQSQQSLALVDMLFRNAPIGFAFVDRALRFVRVNEALAATVGETAEALVGRRVSDLSVPLGRQLEPLVQEVLASGQFLLHDRSGRSAADPQTLRHWTCGFYPVHAGAAPGAPGPGELLGVGIVLSDVTERERNARELRESEARLRAVITNAPVVLFAIDQAGIFTLAEGRGLKAVGFLPGQLVGTSVFDVAKGLPEIEESFRRALAGESFERVLRFADRWLDVHFTPLLDAHGRADGAMGVSVDITDRRNAELDLRAAYDNLERVVKERTAELAEAQRIARMGRWQWDLSTDRIHLSEELRAIYGLAGPFVSREQLIDRAWHDDAAALRESLRQASQQDWSSFEHRVGGDGGRLRTLQLRSHLIRDDERHAVQVVGTAQDITEAKAVERQLRESLEQKEILFKEVHHRVKNNLQVISSLMNLQSRRLTDPRARDILEDSHARVRAIALVHERLYRSPDLTSVDAQEYLESLAGALLRTHASTEVAIELKVDARGRRLEVDAAVPCGLVVNELVTNALKHAFVGRERGRLVVRLSAEGSWHRLAVQDDGVGFPAGLDFERATTLGLRLVRSLAEQLGGQLTIQGEEGAEVVLRWPAGVQGEQAAARP